MGGNKGSLEPWKARRQMLLPGKLLFLSALSFRSLRAERNTPCCLQGTRSARSLQTGMVQCTKPGTREAEKQQELQRLGLDVDGMEVREVAMGQKLTPNPRQSDPLCHQHWRPGPARAPDLSAFR